MPFVDSWSPTPKFQLRLDCARRATRGWPPGRFLEVGAGVGVMAQDFLRRGFSGVCFDPSSENCAIMRQRFADESERLEIVSDLRELPDQQFDYLLAFEVLEHIEADQRALFEWARWLKPGGRLALSVPAHQRKYGPDDQAVGHFRRYEKEDLRRLLATRGFLDVRILNYGFPLGNLSRRLAGLMRSGEGSEIDCRSFQERSYASGCERPLLTRRLSWAFAGGTLLPFLWLQRPFFTKDLGDGFVATAELCPDTAKMPPAIQCDHA